jgi:hypothetical protein
MQVDLFVLDRLPEPLDEYVVAPGAGFLPERFAEQSGTISRPHTDEIPSLSGALTVATLSPRDRHLPIISAFLASSQVAHNTKPIMYLLLPIKSP